MLKLILVFLGSGAGGVLRYAVGSWAQRVGGGAFPLGTLAVNLAGCLLIGFVGAAFAGRAPVREEYRLALAVGLLGGFTTFSAFGFETFALLHEGHYMRAGANVFLSVAGGLAGVWAGYRLGQASLGV
jgi:CrcB protein